MWIKFCFRLTAWALRVFNDINFPDWEFHIWIDPLIFVSIVKWLLTNQNKNGLFFETASFNKYHFDGRIRPNVRPNLNFILSSIDRTDIRALKSQAKSVIFQHWLFFFQLILPTLSVPTWKNEKFQSIANDYWLESPN